MCSHMHGLMQPGRSLPQARNHLGVACSDHGKSHFEGSLLSDLISTLMFHLAGNAGKRRDIYNLSQVTTIQIQWRRGVHQKLWVPHWLQWNIIFENDSSIAILSALSYPVGSPIRPSYNAWYALQETCFRGSKALVPRRTVHGEGHMETLVQQNLTAHTDG